MGYYTDYSLSAEWRGKSPEPTREKINGLEEEIERMNVFDFDGDFDYGWWAIAKWYDWEKDMALLSKRFPDFLFTLEGNGENPDDIWGAYFLDGRIMRDTRIIVTKPFDAEKLTPASSGESNLYSYQEV